MNTPLQLLLALYRAASTGSHPVGWIVTISLLFLALAGCDIAAVAWAASLVSATVLLAAAFSFVLISVFILVSVWILEAR